MKNESGYQSRIKSRMAASALAGVSILMVVTSGCATQSAPDIKGRWVPVNGFSEKTEAIPLRRPYLFYASPTDKTLKTMLSRWSQDSNMTLTYLHPHDFTLHKPVTHIRTGDLQEAVSLLTRIYAEQQVSITASQKEIVVKASEPGTAIRTPGVSETAITK